MRVVLSTSAAARLAAARRFVDAFPPSTELVIVGATRGAADEFARTMAHGARATFGFHRFSLTQLAARFALPRLAGQGLLPATSLGVHAVAARALFDAVQHESLSYFSPVADTPRFPRALARTLEELALARVPEAMLDSAGGSGRDLRDLLGRFDVQCRSAKSVDREAFLRVATEAVGGTGEGMRRYGRCPLLLLDAAVVNATERAFVEALVAQAPDAFATVPAGDVETLSALTGLASFESLDREERGGLDRVRRYLFADIAPSLADPIGQVELFSAPGEGREAVEIARRIVREARRGVPFDRMAIVLRSPQHYAGLLEHALERAGIPAYFQRGTRRPHPSGRAFLALVACALDNLSARRFAEYLSLGQVPDESPVKAADVVPSSNEEVFGALGERAVEQAQAGEVGAMETEAAAPRALRAPWRWERLLVDSRVVAGADRWARRLSGLVHECELQQRELAREEPESPRLDQLARKIEDLQQLAAFALPLMETLSAWPAETTWAEWLDALDALAPRVLRHPSRVLRVLADLRPMGAIGPVPRDEVARVLTERLLTIEAEPPQRRYGRVFVGVPSDLRGRAFAVVFVPALAERMFPQKLREDPLLLDDVREQLNQGLPATIERREAEKLHLRLALGAAESRVYVSFPSVEVGEGRPRVPSLYALEVWRAMTGRVPSADELQQAAARQSQAALAWPAPVDPHDAVDALEHDLATLRALVHEPEDRSRGRARYILGLNPCLQRSVRERYMRAKKSWTHWDGITTMNERVRPALDEHRLGRRVYSLSALQRYSTCPYQFLLGAIYRMRPAEDLEPLQRMDPLTRGSLFHAMQTAFYRRLLADGQLPVTAAGRDRALSALDDAIHAIASDQYELLAPAVDRVWHDEIGGIRRDLRLWVEELARAGGEWAPRHFEWAFGFRAGSPLAIGRDPASYPDPVAIDGRFSLHGSIDLVEERAGTGELRVTDHKTGKYRGKDRMVIGGGAMLQPVLYSLALEHATGRAVVEGRLYYATTDGGYRQVRIPLTPQARRMGVEALEIIDRAIEVGFLAPAPVEKGCTWCDFRPVCGPLAARRVTSKSQEPLADLIELRKKP